MKGPLLNTDKKISIKLEDKDFLVIEKPPGLLVYLPHGAKHELTVTDFIEPYLSFNKKGIRSGIVHRLDRDTSGLMIIARNEQSERTFKAYFRERKIEKIYLALVQGKIEPERGEINIPLGRGNKDRLRIVPAIKGREAITLYKLIKYYPNMNFSLVEVQLLTGRTHQIRVHFAAIGHPIVGDVKYSHKKDYLKRQFLHAQKLVFLHPKTGKMVSVLSNLPKDLSDFLKNAT